ncbi:uncharacterized protein si:dkey-29h14.10 [Plectropomus leopardus]|uniref:uncharacterized protein si:dkey-29h14.10 n=1 Tax=Plectropomus leopardus TaxID=160734 RepID=UPI001C4DD658|nr:uncharacterized protein si:dkey-29h14.10 [Plectropomus leopardus]
MMDEADPLHLWPLDNSSFTKESTPSNQVMTLKAFSVQKIVQMMQMVVQKSCRRACQLFCWPSDTPLCEKIKCSRAQNHQPTDDTSTQVALLNPPSTILIVNISNSTLIDCVIGNDTYPSAVTESQPLMQESELRKHDQTRCSCSHTQQGAGQASALPPPLPPSAEPPSISISQSHLNCVIIGDNNYMHADQTLFDQTEEPEV